MFRFRKTLLAASVALAMAWASPATADTILFNPDGTGAGGALTVDVLDQSPGAASAQDITVQTAFVGQTFELLYQANLGSTQGPGQQYSAAEAGQTEFFTFTAQFTEEVTGVAFLAGGAVLTFDLAANQLVNEFTMYASNAPGDNYTGTGFDSGNIILQGHAVQTTGPTTSGSVDFSSVFNFTCVSPLDPCAQPLDQVSDANGDGNVNDYPGVTTLPGNGSATIPVLITFADPNYFPDLLSGTIIRFAVTNTSLFTPFTGSDPPQLMFDGTPGVGDVDPVNGWSGPDTLLNADAQTSFRSNVVAPEPGVLTLFGLALLGAGARFRNRRD